MRSDRLIRKSHFRRLNARDCGPESDLIDLSKPDTAWTLSELRAGAARTSPETVQEEPSGFRTEFDILLWAARMIDHSPTARALCADADSNGWSIGLTDLNNEGFYIDSDARTIYLDHFQLLPDALGRSAYFRNIVLTTFIRSLRDVWHDERLQDSFSLYAPEQLLMQERIRAADCDTAAILCGWELRGAGFAEVWRHLLGSEEGDMAIIFTRFLERDPGSLFSGAALAYAFRQWYADTSRVDGVDHDTLEMMDDMMMDHEGINPFGTGRINASDIEKMTRLPDGSVYLSGLGDGVLRDPFFAGLNDPVNQTHLFHLMYDLEVVMVNNVPFRDSKLARKIFPQADMVRIR